MKKPAASGIIPGIPLLPLDARNSHSTRQQGIFGPACSLFSDRRKWTNQNIPMQPATDDMNPAGAVTMFRTVRQDVSFWLADVGGGVIPNTNRGMSTNSPRTGDEPSGIAVDWPHRAFSRDSHQGHASCSFWTSPSEAEPRHNRDNDTVTATLKGSVAMELERQLASKLPNR